MDALQLGLRSRWTPSLFQDRLSCCWLPRGIRVPGGPDFAKATGFDNVLFLGRQPGTLSVAIQASLTPSGIATAMAELPTENLVKLLTPDVITVLPQEKMILGRL